MVDGGFRFLDVLTAVGGFALTGWVAFVKLKADTLKAEREKAEKDLGDRIDRLALEMQTRIENISAEDKREILSIKERCAERKAWTGKLDEEIVRLEREKYSRADHAEFKAEILTILNRMSTKLDRLFEQQHKGE